MARSTADDPSARISLTPRQEEILGLIQRGLTNGQIAERLDLSLDGVKWHVREIFARLDVASREEAVAVWRDRRRSPNWLQRATRAALPASFGLRIAAGSLAAVGGVAGTALLIAALNSGEEQRVAAGGEQATPTAESTKQSAALTPTPTAEPAAFAAADPATACISDLLIGSNAKREAGAVVVEWRITKPRTCDLTGPIEAFVLEDGAGFAGPRLLTVRAGLVAPVGTDFAFITVNWTNWCRTLPTPVPTPTPGGPPFPPGPPPGPMWLQFTADSGSNGGTLYPDCISPGSPTALAITTRAEPDPPATAVTIPPAPAVRVAQDVPAFAAWFATVVGAREDKVLDALVPAGQPGYILSQSGETGAEDVMRLALVRATGASGKLRSAGCDRNAANCERFVLAFEAIPGVGPGSYQAYLFESVGGNVVLRGVYPGGGDADVVLSSGQARTPWGEVFFFLLTTP